METESRRPSAQVQKMERANKRAFWRMAIGGSTVCIVMILLDAWNFGWRLSGAHHVWAAFGEFLGGVLGPIFAFAAFLVLLQTLQDQQIKSAEDQERLEQEWERQDRRDFESTFFNLLRVFSEIVAGMTYTFQGRQWTSSGTVPAQLTHVGRAALQSLYENFRKDCESLRPEGELAALYERLYDTFYKKHQAELGIYFRSLYHIFEFVDTSGLDAGVRNKYANIARAQLSAFELGLIFYNGLWDEGRRGFKPLIEKYGILRHIKAESVVQKSDITDRSLYAETAFVGYKKRLESWGGNEPTISYD